MNVLITGGFGYLGGRLAQFFASQSDYKVFLGSRQHRESPTWLPKVNVVQMVWDSKEELTHACKEMDVIVHLAGMNSQNSILDPVSAFKVNSELTEKLLTSSIKNGVKRFIYLSTAHVYGSPLEGTITEETYPTNTHPYASSHRAGEDVIRAAHQRDEIKGIVIRLSNAYGAPMHKEVNCWMLLVNDLCLQAIKGRQLLLHSSGLQLRDFITLNDTVRAIEYFIRCPVSKLGDGLFNLGGNKSSRVIDFAKDIAERCYITNGYRPTIQHSKETNPFDISRPLDYRIDKLLRTGFKLKGNGNDEIDATLRFCQNHFKVKK